MDLYTKHELRQLYREKRIHLSSDNLSLFNELLLYQVKRLDLGGLRTIHLFLPIEGNHEPDTYAIADWLKAKYPQVRLAISKSDSKTSGMTPIIWESQTALKENRWKIPEPENGTPIFPYEIDALFVPLLAFDSKGNRVGYGKGFYDRFLSECRPDAVKIGLSLFDPVTAISDLNEYDIPLNKCITPTKTWTFDHLA